MKRCNLNRDDYKMVDDITGLTHMASEMRRLTGEQEGLYTHWSNWDEPNPQLHIKGRQDNRSVPIARPEPPVVFRTNVSPDDL